MSLLHVLIIFVAVAAVTALVQTQVRRVRRGGERKSVSAEEQDKDGEA